MDFRQLLGGDMAIPAPGQDTSTNDTAETIQISSLALLKVSNIFFISPIIISRPFHFKDVEAW